VAQSKLNTSSSLAAAAVRERTVAVVVAAALGLELCRFLPAPRKL
jgi:hypothetical protein